ncbi:MAG: hypothetical protein IPO27_17695 [Bacteroidetes bacterium]|nr:hypothetical protein [Bacteroidota bacterium]
MKNAERKITSGILTIIQEKNYNNFSWLVKTPATTRNNNVRGANSVQSYTLM